MTENIKMMVLQMPVSQLEHHPDNPRKELGDLTELADSIGKKGVMQNLTIIPQECRDLPVEQQPGMSQIRMDATFYVLIGNRRMEAAKQAGLKTLPCRIITGLSKKDQIAIMLEENMQRNDLTIKEQGDSFQLMLDLGDSVEDIREKTGFSKSTIYHRLNIAKLDGDILQEKEEDESFQLTMADMYALEKIESVEKRNEVLKKATGSSNLRYLADQAADEEKEEKRLERFAECMQALDIEKAPKGTAAWSNGWKITRSINLSAKFKTDEDFEQELQELELLETDKEMGWKEEYGWAYVMEKRELQEQSTETSAEQNAARSKAQLQGENTEWIRKQCKQIVESMRALIYRTITEKRWGDSIGGTGKITDALWNFLLKEEPSISYVVLEDFFDWDIPEEVEDDPDEYAELMKEKTESIPRGEQMLIFAWSEIQYAYSVFHNGKYDKENAGRLLEMAAILKDYGFSLTETEQSVLDGSSPLYTKEEDDA